MKSRERVQTALAHQEPDRVPIDLGGTVVSTIAIPTYAALRRHLGLPEKPVETLEVVHLPYGTPAEVREEVRQRIRDLAPGGGFVFNPVHNIQPNVPPANVAAMFDAALEFGMYNRKQA